MMESSDDTLPAALTRRAFVLGAAGAIPALYMSLSAASFAAQSSAGIRLGNNGGPPGTISRQRQPDNVEFPFGTLDTFYTPNEQFYIRTHFRVPEIAAKDWKLSITGAVKHPFTITYDELQRMPAVIQPALLECSGNSRVFLEPPQTSIRWELGGVSNAEWTGVRLADLLTQAGVEDDAVEVILEGADRGSFQEPNPKTPGVISYARSLPIQKSLRPEVLLAYGMNGKDLPPAHGFPVRAVVAGWYGMASVKWITRIIVTRQPFSGYFQTFMYTVWERRHGLPTLVPVSDMAVKAEIARPMPGEVVPVNSMYRIMGAAWAGESEVTQVEVSTDGARSWRQARFIQDSIPFAWRFWDYEWQTPKHPTRQTVLARATDSRGRTQPMERDEDRRDAMISHVLPVEVEVR